MVNGSPERLIRLSRAPRFLSCAAVVGHEESRGPLGTRFDFHDDTDRFGQPTWELAEGEMSRMALSFALRKRRLAPEAVSVLFAGDLQNQCVASSVGLYSFGIPYIGLYGACSTCTEAILLSSLYLSEQPQRLAAAVTSSHNCAAERQFRTPIEYGAQRSPTAQWTATAAGAFLLCGSERSEENLLPVAVRAILPGKIVNSGVSDPSDMGAAMAPAAADSILTYFEESGDSVKDLDAVVTGDLGRFGSELLLDLCAEAGTDISSVHTDCGKLLFDSQTQDVHSGGSGCGCSAAVLCAEFLPSLARGERKRILFLSTGALMSPSSVKQRQSIGGVAPLILLENTDSASGKGER